MTELLMYYLKKLFSSTIGSQTSSFDGYTTANDDDEGVDGKCIKTVFLATYDGLKHNTFLIFFEQMI